MRQRTTTCKRKTRHDKMMIMIIHSFIHSLEANQSSYLPLAFIYNKKNTKTIRLESKSTNESESESESESTKQTKCDSVIASVPSIAESAGQKKL